VPLAQVLCHTDILQKRGPQPKPGVIVVGLCASNFVCYLSIGRSLSRIPLCDIEF
jgi:hypothetical protein